MASNEAYCDVIWMLITKVKRVFQVQSLAKVRVEQTPEIQREDKKVKRSRQVREEMVVMHRRGKRELPCLSY